MIASKMEEGKIVVPWNFSQASRAALSSAWEIAGDASRIRVIHVATPLTGPDNGALYESAEKHKTRELNKRFQEQIANDERFQNVPFFVNYGIVAHEIVRFAELYRTGLIVMASRDRKGLSRLLFGGLPERVVRLAKCPVLTVQGVSIGQTVKNTRWHLAKAWSKPQPQEAPVV